MNHRPSTQLSILRSLHFRPLEPIAGDEAIVAGTSSAGGLLIVVPEMGNAAAAGRAQYASLESRNILPGAILVNLRGVTPQLAAGAVDPLSGSEDQIRPRRRSSVPAVHPGAAEPLL